MRRHADGRSYLLDLLSALAYVDRAGGAENCVFIAGGARSGTTWLMELINAHRDHRVVFEPFAAHKVRFLPGFHREQYIRSDDQDPLTARLVDRVIHGRYRSWWTDQHNRTLLCRKRLIKAIRANLCLGYIRRRYPRMPIILLLRHPCAAAHSMMRLGYGQYPLQVFLDQPQLMRDHLEPYAELLRTTDDWFDVRVIRWCVQHKVLFSQLRQGDVHLMFYEELCEQPEPSLEAMCAYLGRAFDDAMRAVIHRPSRLAAAHSAIVNDRPLLDAWREHVTDEQMRRAMHWLKTFGLDDLYGEQSRPNRAAAERRLAPERGAVVTPGRVPAGQTTRGGS